MTQISERNSGDSFSLILAKVQNKQSSIPSPTVTIYACK